MTLDRRQQLLAAGKSYIKVFLAVVLAAFLADGADLFDVSTLDLRTWLAMGVASVLPLVISALDASDGRYGRGYVSDRGPGDPA